MIFDKEVFEKKHNVKVYDITEICDLYSYCKPVLTIYCEDVETGEYVNCTIYEDGAYKWW